MIFNSNKGAVVFYFMFIAIMGVAGYILISVGSDSYDLEFIGSTQQKMMNAQENSLQLKQFIEMSIDMAILMSLEELYRSSFVSEVDEDTDCYTVVYNVFNSKESLNFDCFVDYKEEFKFLFRKNFDVLLDQYRNKMFLDSSDFVIDLSESGEGLIIRVWTREALNIQVYHDFSYFKDPRLSDVLVVGMPRYSYQGVPLVPIRNIPNVVCDETDTSYGKICAGNAELVAQLRKLSEEVLVPRDLTMVITQAYRTYAIQQRFWDDWCLKKDQCEMACNPSATDLCPHMVAGAIDLILYDAFGSENVRGLNDDSSSDVDKQEVYDLMCQYDFVRYRPEPWHFEYGTRQWDLAQSRIGSERCVYP